MINLNRATILGNLTKAPEMRYTPNGTAVATLSIATNRVWKDDDGNKKEAAEYHNVVIWGKQAENTAQWSHKGDPIFIEGRLQTQSWEDRDGVKRYRTEIIAERVINLPRKNSENSDQPQSTADRSEDDAINIEDIPF